MKKAPLKQLLLGLTVVSFILVSVPLARAAREEGGFNDCQELPCTLVTEGGDYVTVSGEYSGNAESVHINTLVTDSRANPQIRVNLEFNGAGTHYGVSGTVIRYGDNVFGLPELALTVDELLPVSPAGQPGFAAVTPNEAVALTLLTGLTDTDGDGTVTSPCEMVGQLLEENTDCKKSERGPFESSFTLSSLIIIPWFEGEGAKECAVKHDVCYENATSQGERLQCDLDLMLCLQTEEPWGVGGHILSWVGISVGGSFVFNPSADECLCEYEISDEQVEKLAPAGSHDLIITYKGECCEPGSNCVEGNHCFVDAVKVVTQGDIRFLQGVLTIDGKCKKNPNYVAPEQICEDITPPVDCEWCPIF